MANVPCEYTRTGDVISVGPSKDARVGTDHAAASASAPKQMQFKFESERDRLVDLGRDSFTLERVPK